MTEPTCDHEALDCSVTLPLADAIAITYARPITRKDGSRFGADEMNKVMVDGLREGSIEGVGVCPTCQQPVYRSLLYEGDNEGDS